MIAITASRPILQLTPYRRDAPPARSPFDVGRRRPPERCRARLQAIEDSPAGAASGDKLGRRQVIEVLCDGALGRSLFCSCEHYVLLQRTFASSPEREGVTLGPSYPQASGSRPRFSRWRLPEDYTRPATSRSGPVRSTASPVPRSRTPRQSHGHPRRSCVATWAICRARNGKGRWSRDRRDADTAYATRVASPQ